MHDPFDNPFIIFDFLRKIEFAVYKMEIDRVLLMWYGHGRTLKS